jgi:hypothetical protein
MPNYAQMNVLENKNKLPDFFWTGKTKWIAYHAINQSLDEAYAHQNAGHWQFYVAYSNSSRRGRMVSRSIYWCSAAHENAKDTNFLVTVA